MAIPAVVKEVTYRVGDIDSPIVIEAQVGSGQRGVPVAILDENTILPHELVDGDGGHLRFRIQRSSTLIGHGIRIQTFVTDANPHTNLTIVNYEISGGPQLVKDNTQQEVEPNSRIGHFYFISFKA